MYEARQHKDKVSRRIDGSGLARQNIKFIRHRYSLATPMQMFAGPDDLEKLNGHITEAQNDMMETKFTSPPKTICQFTNFDDIPMDDGDISMDDEGSLMDVEGSLMDVEGSLMDVENSLMDVENSLMDVEGSLMDDGDISMDDEGSLMDVENSLIDDEDSSMD